MKIQFETKDENQEIFRFLYHMNNLPEHHCHLCPREEIALQKELNRILSRKDASLLVLRDETGKIQGVFRVLAEPEERYLEIIWGFVEEPLVYEEMFAYFRREYTGCHLDVVVTKTNQEMMEAYQKQGIIYDEEQIMMLLQDYTPKSVEAAIIPYDPIYEKSYRVIHQDEGVYWTAQRMLNALDRYHVLLVLEKGEAVGYAEITKGYDENEPIQIYVKPECRGKGYGRGLLQRAIEDNMPSNMMLEVYVNNTPALELYRSLGFREVLREYMGSMTI
ncbi:MAG: GNAT family N-acetyltransferase [Ruminococcaceae bacterium]|nr:GNAT family N-acetyltransferase [Oscillospiraceae bacterium]